MNGGRWGYPPQKVADQTIKRVKKKSLCVSRSKICGGVTLTTEFWISKFTVTPESHASHTVISLNSSRASTLSLNSQVFGFVAFSPPFPGSLPQFHTSYILQK